MHEVPAASPSTAKKFLKIGVEPITVSPTGKRNSNRVCTYISLQTMTNLLDLEKGEEAANI